MADVIVNSSMEHKIDALASATREMEQTINMVNSSVKSVESSVKTVSKELEELRKEFESMRADSERSAAINQASTELVRIRQELEQNFGNYKIVRETMLGVLQATDLAIVRQETISRASEELMLSTPEYWLAPCLVAVSAWIGNDRELAERAIKEAVRRDEEKTALTMALICRRNNRQTTCYEWLSIYFAKQNSANFSEASFSYIDAYVNGIFGPDEKHMCDDYITKWMNEIRGNSSRFEESQEKLWVQYCEGFATNVDALFPDLHQSVQEYPQINDYIKRINTVDSIADNFGKINEAYIDTEGLKAKVDKNLISLICRYDAKEEPLRKEEKYCNLIKTFEGDKRKAREYILAEEAARKEKTLNLVEQMTKVITSKEEMEPSKRKTAVSFLSGYIRKGYNTYITENKEAFPKQINFDIDGWKGTTVDTSNSVELMQSYEAYMRDRQNKEVESAKTSKPMMFTIISIAAAVLGAISLIIAPPVGVLLLIGAGVFLGLRFKAIKDMNNQIDLINQNYEQSISDGKRRISNILSQWHSARNVVYEFEQKPLRDIIA